MNPGDKRSREKGSDREHGEHKTPDKLRLEELQEEIEKTEKKIKHLQTMDEYKKTMAKDNEYEMDIAERAKEQGINMSAPLLSGKDYEDFEQELRNRAAAEEAEDERAHFEDLGQKLRKELDSEKKDGGKNKRKSHKYKNHKNKSYKRKSHKNKRKSHKRSKH